MWLSILKYSGLLIAAISSVWGITTDVSIEVDGKKKLSKEGYVAVILVGLGFLISVISTIVEDRMESDAREARLREDIRRTNKIILSGQPITSLYFSWQFNDVSREGLDLIWRGDTTSMGEIGREQQGGVRGPSQNGPAFRRNSLYPFIKMLFRNTADNEAEQFVMLISFDRDQTTVMPMAYLMDTATIEGKVASDYSRDGKFPVGVETVSSNEASFQGYGNSRYNYPQISYEKDTVYIDWYLDPVTFADSYNTQVTDMSPSAYFPDTLKVALLYDFETLPFESENFALAPDYIFWDDVGGVEPVSSIDTLAIQADLLKRSSLYFTPNALRDQTVSYRFLEYFAQPVVEKDVGEAVACNALVLVFVR